MARGEGSRSVRVFTVASESRYVVVRNVPALGVIDDLLKRLSLYGKVCEYRLLDHPDDRHAALQHVPGETHAEATAACDDDAEHQFTDVVWVQYETVNNARHAKVRGVQKPFFGSRLQISYAPQFESRADTAAKLAQRRQLLQRRARPASNPTAGSSKSAASSSDSNSVNWAHIEPKHEAPPYLKWVDEGFRSRIEGAQQIGHLDEQFELASHGANEKREVAALVEIRHQCVQRRDGFVAVVNYNAQRIHEVR
ncbi:hypothetical protein BBJ28_00016214 [Nothophytophthora sp. Chile5]|nr:hypothetical protein BBJ28_00016214 [Nothophytophthora sp. Chile5]